MRIQRTTLPNGVTVTKHWHPTRPVLATIAIVSAQLAVAGAIMVGALFTASHAHAGPPAMGECGGATITLDGVPTAVAICQLPKCEYEDGNPDGLPCLWTDPTLGAVYYNDGSNYRN